jgi:hypothetical protein
VDPTLVNAGIQLLGGAIKSPVAPAGPSNALSGATGSSVWLDSSGWNVATHGSTATQTNAGDRYGPGTGGLSMPPISQVVQPGPSPTGIPPNTYGPGPSTTTTTTSRGSLLMPLLIVGAALALAFATGKH